MAPRLPNRKTQAPGSDAACALERLEPRLLLSVQSPDVQALAVAPLNVALVSDAVAQAELIQETAARDTIVIVYRADSMTTSGLVHLLSAVSAEHGGARIGHLGIVTHGGPGEIDLGMNDNLNVATLPGQAKELEQLRSLLTNDARLDLYSCSVAAGAAGKTFVDQLAAETGAIVFASDDPVGTAPGSDFDWEYHTGQAAASNELFSPKGIQATPGLCLTTVLTGAQVAQAAFNAGFRSTSLVYAVAIAQAESSFVLDAVHTNTDGSVDRGLWQINSVHCPPSGPWDPSALLSSADYNAQAAYAISSNGANWRPWAAFYTFGQYNVPDHEGAGPYLNYLGDAITWAFSVDPTVVHAIGDTVVATASGLRVRDTPGASIPQPQQRYSGDTAVIIGYWQRAQIGGSGKTWIWWKVRWSDGQTGWSAQDYLARTGSSPSDTTPPTVNAFDVQPRSIAVGSQVAISYTVSDAGGSELKQVELWRTDDPAGTVWPQPPNPIDVRSVSGSGPVSGTFYDGSALPAGTYWYGLHVVDNASPGNWNDEQNSSTGHLPGDFGPVMVTVQPPSVVVPAVSINDVSQAEGNGGTTIFTFTISLSQATTVPVSVSYATANGTAVAPGDYAADSGVLTFNAGETAKSVTVGVVGDTTVEPDETFYVNLSGASGATIADAEGQGRILNDDVAVPTIFVNDVMLDEGDVGTKDFTFTITVAGPIGEDVWFSWRLVDGSARVWTDYLPAYGGAHVAQPCSFDATVPVCGDTIVEPEETFFLEIYDVVNATLAVGGGVGTIKNDDLGGIIQFSASGYSVDEDAGAATVTVIRTGGSASDVSVDYATSGDTATPGADYAATSGSVIFGAGEASRNITIPILDDSLVEGSERFNVRLSNPGGGGAIGPQDIAVITIVDREQPADTVKPTATVGHPLNGSVIPLATINVAERYIDVTFDDQGGSGLNYSTITDEGQEFTLSGAGAGGVTVNGMPTLISAGNYRYSFAGDFASGPVNVNFTAGAWADNAGNTNDAEMETFAVGPGIVNAEVVSRHVFYNRSYFDGNNAVANASDDNAIDASKSALLPGSGPATFPNYTSYSRGINGIMVDIDGLAHTPNAGDFLFKVGNSNDPLMWATAPGPQNIDVRPGAGDGDSDRVTIIWADNAIQKQWLQVTVLSDANGGSLGLSEEDVFYFGNLPGDATGDGQVGGDDLLALEQGFEQTNATFAEGDFDADGRAGCIDYLTLKRYCGETIALLSPPVMAQAGDSVEILIAEPPIVLSDGNVPLEGPSQGEAVTDEVVAAGSGVRAEVPANIEPTTREAQNDADAALTELPAEPAEIAEQAEQVTAQLAWANEQMMAGLMTLSRADRLLNDAPSRWPKTAQAGAGSTVRSAVLNASGKVPAKAIRLVNAETQRVDLLVIASESRTERQPGHGPAVQEEDLLRLLDLTDLTAPALSPSDPWHSRA